jgi:hypothetical protein
MAWVLESRTFELYRSVSCWKFSDVSGLFVGPLSESKMNACYKWFGLTYRLKSESNLLFGDFGIMIHFLGGECLTAREERGTREAHSLKKHLTLPSPVRKQCILLFFLMWRRVQFFLPPPRTLSIATLSSNTSYLCSSQSRVFSTV